MFVNRARFLTFLTHSRSTRQGYRNNGFTTLCGGGNTECLKIPRSTGGFVLVSGSAGGSECSVGYPSCPGTHLGASQMQEKCHTLLHPQLWMFLSLQVLVLIITCFPRCNFFSKVKFGERTNVLRKNKSNREITRSASVNRHLLGIAVE